jgi:hypothetical protein
MHASDVLRRSSSTESTVRCSAYLLYVILSPLNVSNCTLRRPSCSWSGTKFVRKSFGLISEIGILTPRITRSYGILRNNIKTIIVGY